LFQHHAVRGDVAQVLRQDARVGEHVLRALLAETQRETQ
jgi:hypothetical protein